MNQPPIRIVCVGGTIDKIYFDALSEYHIGEPGVANILKSLPIAFDYDVDSLMKKDSLELTEDDRQQIVNHVAHSTEQHVLITHGTDTMVQTGLALQANFEQFSDKRIVLTGAMLPAGFRNSDAVFNVGVAIGALLSLPAGIYIAMNGSIFDPSTARKNRDAQRFENAD
ncbi:MAG: asparaginase domain-containing protein [Fuerstiella sp.]